MNIRIGIIGAGGITRFHLPHLQRLSQEPGEITVHLAAVADINVTAAQELAQEFGIERVVNDWRELLPLVDAVLICVPTHLHASIGCEFLKAGKAVFCEKPLDRTREGALVLAQASQESGAPLQVGFVRRFDDDWLTWRQAILAGKIGRPVVWHDVSSGAGPGNIAWFHRDEQGGGPFLDGCIHNLDFALWTFGPAQWAFCHGRTLNSNHTAIDTGTATVRFQSGDELLLVWSWGLPIGTGGARVFEFLGPEGTLKIAPETEGPNLSYLVERGTNEKTESFDYSHGSILVAFERQMEEFIQVAARKMTPRAGIEAGQDSLELALAILASARSGQVVQMGN